MFKSLVKKQLLESFQSYFINPKTGKARSKMGTALFFAMFVLVFASLGIVFYFMGLNLGSNLLGFGCNWLYFSLLGLVSIALGVFGSVFNTYASVYLPKDNDFLMTLPIPGKTLVLSRLAGVYVMSLLYSAWIWIPITIAYWMLVPVNALNVIFPVILIFVISLFVSVLTCILGWVVALISAKAKGKSFITVILSLLFMGGYYLVYFKITDYLNDIVEHIDSLSDTVTTWLHYIYLLGKAADGNTLSMVIVTAITVILSIACVFVVSKSFMKIAVLNNETKVSKVKTDLDFKNKGINKAILLKQFKHFTSSSTWMLNGGFGLLIMPIIGVLFIINRNAIISVIIEIEEEMPILVNLLPSVVMIGICLIICSNCILPVSISLEGKSLWILQSLPIEPLRIIKTNEIMFFELNIVPAALTAVIIGIVLGFNIIDILLVIAALSMFILLIGDFGLFLDLKHTNLTWTNEVYVVKQSFQVVLNLFGGWTFCVAAGLLVLLLSSYINSAFILIALAVIFATIRMGLYSWIKKKGLKIFQYL